MLQEWIAVIVTVGGLVGLPTWVVHSQPTDVATDRRVIHLTGVKKGGVWTEAAVTSLNYGSTTFEPARISLKPGERVLLRLASADVTHGFYAPELGIGPIEVEPGHIENVLFDADTTGVFTYYCTTVCGDCHHYMRGSIEIDDGGREEPDRAIRSSGDKLAGCRHHLPLPSSEAAIVERGRVLFERKGCAACHGEAGRGGVRNPNYIKETVPNLVELADRMYLYEREDVDTVVGLLAQGADLDRVADDPPFRRYPRFLAQYESVRGVIRSGKVAGRRDTTSFAPPLNMPSWEAVLPDADIDAVLAYLLTEFPWDEE